MTTIMAVVTAARVGHATALAAISIVVGRVSVASVGVGLLLLLLLLLLVEAIVSLLLRLLVASILLLLLLLLVRLLDIGLLSVLLGVGITLRSRGHGVTLRSIALLGISLLLLSTIVGRGLLGSSTLLVVVVGRYIASGRGIGILLLLLLLRCTRHTRNGF